MIDSLIWGKGRLLGRLEAPFCHLDKNVAIIVDLFLVITTVTSCHLSCLCPILRMAVLHFIGPQPPPTRACLVTRYLLNLNRLLRKSLVA
jgi:hypothetical protein